MKTNIKINKKNTLSKRELDIIIENKNTINLSGVKSSNQIRAEKQHTQDRINNRLKQKNNKKENKELTILFIGLILLASVILFNVKVYGDIEPMKTIQIEVKTNPLEQVLQDNPEIEKIISYQDKLFKFIEQGEGAFQSNAFCDSYYKTKYGLIRKSPKDCTRWSIGFGTKSYWGEKITLEEAHKRKEQDILKRDKLITSSCLTDNQRIVAVDYMYQHGNNSGLVKHYANTCQSNRIYNHIVWLRDKYRKARKWGLVKREQKRINLFYNR